MHDENDETKVDDLIAKIHELSANYVEEVADEKQPQRMAEVFAAINYVSGEMTAYLLEVGFTQDDIDKLEAHYSSEGLGDIQLAVEGLNRSLN